MLTFPKIFIFLGLFFGYAHAGKIVRDTDTKSAVDVSAKDSKIYGGQPIPIKEAPYQVHFQGCSGVIISTTFILTVAHCLPGKRFWNYEYLVRVGSAQRSSGGQVIATKKFIPNPKFEIDEYFYDLSYDIGLIELKSPIKLNENASVITLAEKEVPIGEKVLITGWGLTDPNSNIHPEDLQSIKVPIIDRKKCSEKTEEWGLVGLFDPPKVTDAMICNYEEGKETCKGDSGGPVVFNKTLVGLVSWGHPKCSEGPGININLAHPEIQAFIYDNSNVGKISEDAETKDSQGVTTKDTKIVGGRDTHIYEAPYIASLQTTAGHHGCGGVIISRTMILTAGHCIEGKNPDKFNIRVGSSNRTSGGQLIPVKEFYSHPEYDMKNLVYDVGVIELKSSIELNENVTIIELAKEDVQAGQEVMISGWGSTAPFNNTPPEYLQSVNLPILDREICANIFKNLSAKYEVVETMICINNVLGKGQCSGDSGGPLVFNNTLVGVVSWGYSLCNKRLCGVNPGVSANVVHPELREFIEGMLNRTPDDEKITCENNTKIQKAPWTAALENEKDHFCGGTIISNKMILTAAHCVKSEAPNKIKVRVGATCIKKDGQVINVKNITIHPKYNWPEYDVAVIELKSCINFSEKAWEIKLADKEVPADKIVTITGWEYKDINGNRLDMLQFAKTRIIDWSLCKESMSQRRENPWEVTQRMICGQLEAPNTWRGHGGGPVTLNNEEAVGIISWGDKCSTGPSVYTNIADGKIRSFIKDVTGL